MKFLTHLGIFLNSCAVILWSISLSKEIMLGTPNIGIALFYVAMVALHFTLLVSFIIQGAKE